MYPVLQLYYLIFQIACKKRRMKKKDEEKATVMDLQLEEKRNEELKTKMEALIQKKEGLLRFVKSMKNIGLT